MNKDVEKLQQITGYSRDYDSTQKIMSRRHFGNDLHLTKDNEVREYEKICGVVPQTYDSLQMGYADRIMNKIPSLVPNYSFESAYYAWGMRGATVAGSTVATTSTDCKRGNFSLYTTNYLTSNWVQVSSSLIPCRPGDEFYFSGWMKSTGNVHDAHIKVQWYGTDGAALGYSPTFLAIQSTGADWTNHTAWFVVPAIAANSAAIGGMRLFCMGAKVSAYAGTTTADTWFDDIRVTPKSYYHTMTDEKGWLDLATSISADIFGQWRVPFENSTWSTVGTTATVTRSSCTATVKDSTGKLQEVTTANIARYENSKFDQGIWIEREDTNIILNSSFESGLVGWSSQLTSTSVSENTTSIGIMHGSKCAQIDTAVGSSDTFTQLVSVPAGTATISCYVLVGGLTSANSSSVRIYFATTTGGTGIVPTYEPQTQSKTAVTRMYTTQIVSASANYYVGVWINGNTSLRLDAVQLNKNPFCSTYIPTTNASAIRNTEYVTYPLQGAITGDGGTIVAWFKPNWNGNDGISHYIYRNVKTTDALSGELNFYKDNFNNLKLQILDLNYAEANIGVSVANSIFANTWTHVAAAWCTGAMKLYLNGRPVGVTANLTGRGICGNWSTAPYIGSSAGGNSLDGLLDDIAIYDRMLTDEEILNTYEKGL